MGHSRNSHHRHSARTQRPVRHAPPAPASAQSSVHMKKLFRTARAQYAKTQSLPGESMIEDALNLVLAVTASDDHTQKIIKKNILSDCKQFGFKDSKQGCADPTQNLFDSIGGGDGLCHRQDEGTSPDSSDDKPTVNSRAQVWSCGTSEMSASQKCAYDSAVKSCAAAPVSQMSNGTLIALLLGFGIPTIVIVGAMVRHCYKSRHNVATPQSSSAPAPTATPATYGATADHAKKPAA